MKKAIYLLGLLSCFSCQNEQPSQLVKPQLSQVTESVYASVSIKPKVAYFPQTSRSGIIQEVAVKKGDQVTKGQVLFSVLTANADNRLIDARLNLDQAKANYLGENNLLANVKLELEMAVQQLALDSINLNRQKHLWDQKIGAKIDLDRAEIKYETTLNQYRALQKKQAQTYLSLENNYRKALNMVDNERTSLNDFIVRSEITGTVYDVYKEPGELIGPQERFAEIGSTDSFLIDMNIDEIDITKINLGDTALITLEAYPDEVFKAQIARIYPKKEENTQTFFIEGFFLKAPPKLYNGLSGEANIIVAIRENVLTIPANYLKPGNTIVTPDGEKTVITGMKNMDFVEIISGIDTSTILIKPVEE